MPARRRCGPICRTSAGQWNRAKCPPQDRPRNQRRTRRSESVLSLPLRRPPLKPQSRVGIAARLVMALCAVAALVVLVLFLRSPELPPVVISSLQITSDGISKRSLVTDGTRLYFSENVSGHSVLRQVSTSGGETAPVPISLVSADIYDFYPGRSELLVKGVAEGSETEWPVWILPLPAGSLRPVGDILAHGATWAPDGQHIVYVRKSSLYIVQCGWNRFAGAGHRAGSSFCAAIFSRWPPLAFHHPGHQPAHFFSVGGLARRQRAAPAVAGLEQAPAGIWRSLDAGWRILPF